MKVVIFDPNLSNIGHYKYFNRHIIKLLDSKNIEIYMADYSEYFQKWYSSLKLENASLKIVNVSKYAPPRKRIEGQIKNPVKSIYIYEKEKKWYKEISQKINLIRPDIVILTSQGSPALYKVFNCDAPIVMITHTIKELLDDTWKTKNGILRLKLKKHVKMAQKFLNKLANLIVLEKKTSDFLNDNGLKSWWFPYMLFSLNKDDVNENEDKKKDFVISTVGVIYKGKNIEFVLDSLKKRNENNFKYRIAGLPTGEYGQYIRKKTMEFPNNMVEYRFEYLSDEDYVEEIKKSDFIVIPYSENREDQASGVFFDALKYNKPVITPNIDPFKSYIDAYKIGLMFEKENNALFLETVDKAKKLGSEYFSESITKFKEDFSYKNWNNKFVNFIKSVISSNGEK